MASVLVVGWNADASIWNRHKPAQPKAAVPAVSGMALTAIETGTGRIVLRTSGTPAYTSYSPSPDVFVVDITAAAKGPGVTIPAPLPPGVASITADEAVEMGTRLMRVTFRLANAQVPQAAAGENAVVVTFAQAEASASPAIPDAVPAIAAGQQMEAPAQHSETIEPPVVSEPMSVAEPPANTTLNRAKKLKSIETAGSGAALEVRIAGDGAMTYHAFRLENPARLVIDVPGVKSSVVRSSITVDDPLVRKVRVGQFKGAPDPVARVVVELGAKTAYHVTPDGNQLRVTFGDAPAMAAAAPVATPPAGEARARKPADIPAAVPVVAENATWKMPAEKSAPRGAKAVITATADQAPPYTPPRQTVTTGAGATSSARSAAAAAGQAENVFNEPTSASSQTLSGGGTMTTAGGRTLSGGQRVYNGEPISLNLKDADLKDVLRTFAQLTGLNIAVDPDVSGSVTVDFVDVPWDQALDLILRQNNLTYVLEGNVMRVGRLDRIAQETAATRRLADEERLNVPLTTVIFKLSYARAAEVQGLLREIASPRARIIVDTRTNQLIISEIPQYLQTMRNLIDTIDVPTRQVMIEARIVEASKLFEQQYGFQWGFNGALDPALGNGTGLVFPNRVGFTGGPFNFGPGNPVLEFTLTDVLGTFNLDFALNAFEFEGLVKVISAPKVTTQDNTAAEIQSGFQIPYQTRVNFTTTVTYIDAVLRLQVTPQITEAGTVIMEIQVQKTEPTVGLAIEGATGTPLSTRSAKTRLMVRDGGTAVIGGIYTVKDNNSQTRLPFVHQIPVIGNLFKTHNVTSSHDELLIFITPRIIRGT
jgi:type IV pilus assembly protein PilQ